jgi:hypothetical protein
MSLMGYAVSKVLVALLVAGASTLAPVSTVHAVPASAVHAVPASAVHAVPAPGPGHPAETDPAAPLRPRHLPRRERVYLTGYSFHDNTPPEPAVVSHPILHRVAGGQGTYRDPITVAVPGGPTTMTWLPGTRFYLPTVRRYVIVEDSGASPAPRGVAAHLDVWIGGRGGTTAATEDCMSRLTGAVEAIVSPLPGLPVLAGPIFTATCRLPLPPLGRP